MLRIVTLVENCHQVFLNKKRDKMDLWFFIIWCLICFSAPFVINKLSPQILRSVRFLATYMTIIMSGIAVITWYSTKDLIIFLIWIFFAFWGGVNILLLPKTSPKITKKLGLKW
jgi:hypothetical protein